MLRLFCVASCRDSFDHVLRPTDFSENAERAFETVKQQATQHSRKITLFRDQAMGRVDLENKKQLEEINRIDQNRLQTLKKQLESHTDAEINIDIRAGSPAQEIVEKTKSNGATMIIMGRQGCGYIREQFLGGVSYQVLRNAVIPVLIINTNDDLFK